MTIDYIKRINDIVETHNNKSMTQADLVENIAIELHCLLYDSGVKKPDALAAATFLRSNIIMDDWKD